MTQPLPTPGKDKVCDMALLEFVRVHQEQVAKGAAEHGGPLQTFNGRSALTDAQEELCDAWQYLEQAKMEQAEIREKASVLFAMISAFDNHAALSDLREVDLCRWRRVLGTADQLREALDGQGEER
jgi:hypothetical protein